jgi:4-oxalocrotonate tautomerase
VNPEKTHQHAKKAISFPYVRNRLNRQTKTLDNWVIKLPVVQVSVWSGMTKEKKKSIVEGITKVLEELGIPREAITVIIYEAPKTNWATGGQLHSEKYTNR